MGGRCSRRPLTLWMDILIKSHWLLSCTRLLGRVCLFLMCSAGGGGLVLRAEIQSAQFGTESSEDSHLVTNQGRCCDVTAKHLWVPWVQRRVNATTQTGPLHGWNRRVGLHRLRQSCACEPWLWVSGTKLLWFVCPLMQAEWCCICWFLFFFLSFFFLLFAFMVFDVIGELEPEQKNTEFDFGWLKKRKRSHLALEPRPLWV